MSNKNMADGTMAIEGITIQGRPVTPPYHRQDTWQRRVIWGYLLAIAAAELLTFTVNPYAGQLAHALLLIALLLHGALRRDENQRRLALAMTLAPITRLLSLSLPLLRLPQISWYPIVAVPLLLSAWVLIRQLQLPHAALGLRPTNLVLELMLAAGGLGLGLFEYIILQPQPIFSTFTWETFGLALLIFTLATGFPEELIFRGILQATALPVLGKYALLYVALLFAVLHIGYLSAPDVVFVFAVGLLFGCVARWSGSIIGLTLSHGLTNATLFFILPYLREHPSVVSTLVETWIIGLGSAFGIIAVFVIALRSRMERFQMALAETVINARMQAITIPSARHLRVHASHVQLQKVAATQPLLDRCSQKAVWDLRRTANAPESYAALRSALGVNKALPSATLPQNI